MVTDILLPSGSFLTGRTIDSNSNNKLFVPSFNPIVVSIVVVCADELVDIGDEAL